MIIYIHSTVPIFSVFLGARKGKGEINAHHIPNGKLQTTIVYEQLGIHNRNLLRH